MTSDDDYCQGPYQGPEAAKTLVLSCEVISPTANDDNDPSSVSPLATDITQLHHTTQKRLKLRTGPVASLDGPRGTPVECLCPYAVYDRFPCSPHGCMAAAPPPILTPTIPGTSALLGTSPVDNSTSSTTSTGVAGGGGGGGGVVSRRIQIQRRGSHIYNCSPQPELLGCLT